MKKKLLTLLITLLIVISVVNAGALSDLLNKAKELKQNVTTNKEENKETEPKRDKSRLNGYPLYQIYITSSDTDLQGTRYVKNVYVDAQTEFGKDLNGKKVQKEMATIFYIKYENNRIRTLGFEFVEYKDGYDHTIELLPTTSKAVKIDDYLHEGTYLDYTETGKFTENKKTIYFDDTEVGLNPYIDIEKLQNCNSILVQFYKVDGKTKIIELQPEALKIIKQMLKGEQNIKLW